MRWRGLGWGHFTKQPLTFMAVSARGLSEAEPLAQSTKPPLGLDLIRPIGLCMLSPMALVLSQSKDQPRAGWRQKVNLCCVKQHWGRGG
jgi:hypothetical protein